MSAAAPRAGVALIGTSTWVPVTPAASSGTLRATLTLGGVPGTHPLVGLQDSRPLQPLPSSQTSGEPPTHTPEALHASTVVQTLPSLQGVPLALGGFEQSPVPGLQVPAAWHWSDAVQTMGVPAHVPPPQRSPVVQDDPSSHAFVLLVWTQPVDGAQLSVVHTLLSSQLSAA